MSKQHRTAGKEYNDLPINGKTYRFRPLKVGIYAEMENYIISQRGDPIVAASQSIEQNSIDPKYHPGIWQAAMKEAVANKVVTAEQAATFENSVRGLAWKLWMSVRQDHPEIATADDALHLIEEAGEQGFEAIAATVEVGTGEAVLGNSSGREPTQEKTDPAGQ